MAEPADAVAAFEALLTPAGQELLHRLRYEDDPARLRLGTELRASYPVELVTAALAQHELRLRARAKFSRALDMYFTRPGLEHASAEVKVAAARDAASQAWLRVNEVEGNLPIPAGQIAQGGDREHDRIGAGYLSTDHRGTCPGVLGGDPGDQFTGPGHDQVPMPRSRRAAGPGRRPCRRGSAVLSRP